MHININEHEPIPSYEILYTCILVAGLYYMQY